MRVRVREKDEAMITTRWPYIPPADKRNWHPAVDLRHVENTCKISEFPEVKQVPELKGILEYLNSPSSAVFTIGCRAERACKCSRIDCKKRYYYSIAIFISSNDNSISGSKQRTIDALVVPVREQMEKYKSPQQSDFFEISL